MSEHISKLSRRDFLKIAGTLGGSGLLLSMGIDVNKASGQIDRDYESVCEENIPRLQDGNFDFWSIAKIEPNGVDSVKGTYLWKNTKQAGEKGYVYNPNNGSWPKQVEGYQFIKETNMGSSGVTIMEYQDEDCK